MDLDKVIESVGENTEENRMKHKRILMEHYALKGLQWGGFAGLVGLPPYYYFYKRYYFFHIFSRLNTTAGLAGIAGLAISTAIGAYKVRSLSQDEVYHRAYQLNHDHWQNFTDMFSAGLAGGICLVTTIHGFVFGYKPHFGYDVARDSLRKRVLRGALSGCWGFGGGLAMALMIEPVMRQQYEMRMRKNADAVEMEMALFAEAVTTRGKEGSESLQLRDGS